jgi:5,10-methylene-tetrahydrofolate dehydrogenase/methenyl tetrahydrofolate cyclohydrolase
LETYLKQLYTFEIKLVVLNKQECHLSKLIGHLIFTQDECKARILALNDDPTVLGIILQRPVPDHINVRSLQSAIHPLKDVEGMNPASIGNIVYSDVALAPCTAGSKCCFN